VACWRVSTPKDDLNASHADIPLAGSRRNIVLKYGLLSARGLAIAEVVKGIAAEVDKSPAQVALGWTLLNPHVTSSTIGARTLLQLLDNLGALEVTLSHTQRLRLHEVSAIELGFPHDYLRWVMAPEGIFHGGTIEPRVSRK